MSVLKSLNVSEKIAIIQSWSSQVLTHAFDEALDDDRYDEEGIDLDFNRHTMGTPNIQSISYKDMYKELVVKIGRVFPVIYELYNEYTPYVIFNALDNGISVSEFPYDIDTNDMMYYITHSNNSTISKLMSDDDFINYVSKLSDDQRTSIKDLLIESCALILYVKRFEKCWSVEDETLLLKQIKKGLCNIDLHTVKYLFENDSDDMFSETFIRGLFYETLKINPVLINNLKYDDSFNDLCYYCDREVNKIKLLYGNEM